MGLIKIYNFYLKHFWCGVYLMKYDGKTTTDMPLYVSNF